MGSKVADAIIAERDRGGTYKSIFEVCERVDGQAVNKAVLETLIACGAFDQLGRRRAQLAEVVESALQRGSEARKDRRLGQGTLFDLFGESGGGNGSARAGILEETYPDVPEWTESERLSREKKSLGFYLTGHPLLRWQGLVRKYATHALSDIGKLEDGTQVVIGAQIAKLTKKVSKRTGDPFWIALVEDLKGSLEVFVTQEQHEAARGCLQEESLVFLKGAVRYRDTTASLRLDAILPLAEGPQRLTEDLSFVVAADEGPAAEDLVVRLTDLFQRHRGECPVYLVFRNAAGERAILLVGADSFVAPDLDFFESADRICGLERVLVNRMGRRS
jgi:DNA polymerase-3 subunit alpha